MRAAVILVILIGTTVPGCLGDPGGGTAAGGSGPDWSFIDTDGVTHSRDSAAGNASVLFFMASWCSSCRAMTSVLASVHDDVAIEGVRFFSLSFDTTDDDGSLQAWKERYDQPWPHGVDEDLAMQRAFGVTSQSTLVVLDADGDVVRKFGYPGAKENALRAALDEATAAVE